MASSKKITLNSRNAEKALRMLNRKTGATVEQITAALELGKTKAARGLVDRLREKGVKIKNTGPHRFQAA